MINLSTLTQTRNRIDLVGVPSPLEIGGTRSEAQSLKLFRVALPVLGDLDVQVEVDPLTEELLDGPARGGADLLEA